MKICLVVKSFDKKSKQLVKAYARNLDLPFVPTVGMKFKHGLSTWLWETDNGELSPGVKEVVYNIDEETIYCLFEVNEILGASFWQEIKNIDNSFELMQFTTHN